MRTCSYLLVHEKTSFNVDKNRRFALSFWETSKIIKQNQRESGPNSRILVPDYLERKSGYSRERIIN